MHKYFKQAASQWANTVVRQALSLWEVCVNFPSFNICNHLSSGKSWPNQIYCAKSFVAVAINAFFWKCYKANKNKKPAKKRTQENFPCLLYTSNNSILPIKNKKRLLLLKLFEKILFSGYNLCSINHTYVKNINYGNQIIWDLSCFGHNI